jgi:hypothetical protein
LAESRTWTARVSKKDATVSVWNTANDFGPLAGWQPQVSWKKTTDLHDLFLQRFQAEAEDLIKKASPPRKEREEAPLPDQTIEE